MSFAMISLKHVASSLSIEAVQISDMMGEQTIFLHLHNLGVSPLLMRTISDVLDAEDLQNFFLLQT